MKKYLQDFFVWFGLGVFLFFLSSFVSLSPLSWNGILYYLIIFIILFSGYFMRFRRPNNIALLPSIIVSMAALFLPAIIWVVSIYIFVQPEIG